MPLIWTDDDDRVTNIHYQPDQLSEEQKQGSVQLDSIPDRDSDADGNPQPYYNETDGFWYEYN